MTRKEAKDILLKFVEDNKYKSDWNGFLAGAISTYLEPIDEEKLDALSQKAMICKIKSNSPAEIFATYKIGYEDGYCKAMEE